MTVTVIDKQRVPVVGTVLLNPGRLRLGKTNKKDGRFTFNHVCQAGQTFKAEPEDGAKYYESEDQVCSKMVVLEVFPRPQAIGGLAHAFYIKKVNAPPGFLVGNTYAGVFGVVTEKVEPVIGGNKAKCKFRITKNFEVAYYRPQNADWKPVNATLPAGTQREDVIYYFPTSCENAGQQIAEIKKNTNLQLQVGVLDYYTTNSREIGMAVVKAAKPPK